MPANILTVEDLERFKEELLSEIKTLLIKHGKISLDSWIKSAMVMHKLEISPGTLQNMRINGTIPFSKLGGIIYYDEIKIDAILRNNEKNLKNEML